MKLTNIIYNVAVALLIGGICQLNLGIPLMAVTPAILALGAVRPFLGEGLKGFALMAVQVEIWKPYIEAEIFKGNDFLRKSKNADEYVIGGKAVHIPQSGGSGNVSKNRGTLPATVRQRNDDDIIYLIDEFTSDPVLIKDADKKELSYEKRQSVLGEDTQKMNQEVAEWGIYNWLNSPVYQAYGSTVLPVANIMETSGGIITATIGTGNRLAAALKDLQKMKTKFKNENRWFEGKMWALLTPDMEAELFPAESVITATYMQNVTEAERREGVMYKVQGWRIMTRSTVVSVDSGGLIKAPNEAAANDDDEASLFWYEGAVEFAFSGVEFFEELRKAAYYGDLYSCLARAGGRAVRKDYAGIGLLKQKKSA